MVLVHTLVCESFFCFLNIVSENNIIRSDVKDYKESTYVCLPNFGYRTLFLTLATIEVISVVNNKLSCQKQLGSYHRNSINYLNIFKKM